MPPADAPKDPVTVVLPVRDAAAALGPAVGGWLDALGKLGRGYELLIIDDGSTDGTVVTAETLAAERPHVRLLKHDARQGYGAAMRTALAEAQHPLLLFTALDYPYTPGDLAEALDRIGRPEEFFGRTYPVLIVAGRRTGRPVPAGWRAVGTAYRLFCRVALGLPLEPLTGWLGFREHARSWLAWAVFGNPLDDVNAAFKLVHRSVFDKFPLQSDGDFAHAELIAKAAFATCMTDELVLTPKPDPVPRTEWGDFGKVLRNALFTPPPPAVPPPTPPVEVAADPPAVPS